MAEPSTVRWQAAKGLTLCGKDYGIVRTMVPRKQCKSLIELVVGPAGKQSIVCSVRT